MVRGTCIFKTSGQNTFTVDQRGLKRESRNLPLVEYKLEERGKYQIKVDRYFAYSKICSVCGYTKKIKEPERLDFKGFQAPKEQGMRESNSCSSMLNLRYLLDFFNPAIDYM